MTRKMKSKDEEGLEDEASLLPQTYDDHSSVPRRRSTPWPVSLFLPPGGRRRVSLRKLLAVVIGVVLAFKLLLNIRPVVLFQADGPQELVTIQEELPTTTLDSEEPASTATPLDHEEPPPPPPPPPPKPRIPKKKQKANNSDLSVPPHYTDLRQQIYSLPQHNYSLPFPEGANGRYVKFSSQVRELGWNNVLNDVLMNAHLAYRSNRAYVFTDHEWLMRHYPWPPEVAHEDPPLTPMAALMSGPAVGGEWPEGTKRQSQNQNQSTVVEVEAPPPPRAVSSTWFDLVCPPHKRRILNTSDVKPWQRWDMQARSGREVFDIWLLLLTDRASLDNVTNPNPIPTAGLGSDPTIEDPAPPPNGQPKDEEEESSEEYEDEGNDNCLEIVSGSREEDMFPQVFDLWLWGTPRILDLWEEFKTGPISTGLGASPIVERCVQRNMHLFSRHLRVGEQEDLEALERRQVLTTVEQDPLERALAVHVRRGDYKQACSELANWNSTFYSWNQLPFLPDRFTPPPYPGDHVSGQNSEENVQIYLEHCLPDDEAIVRKVESSRIDWEMEMGYLPKDFNPDAEDGTTSHYLETLFLLTNERDPVWLGQLQSQFSSKGGGWKNVVISSLEIVYDDAQEKSVGLAVDMDLARRAAVFIGNGWSSFTSNILHRRLVDGKSHISNRFF
ncbi:hypothetical protein MD484_g4907, partial [Candolleomyces efflorescens]